MIASLSDTVSAANLNFSPAGALVPGSLFGWNGNSYFQPDRLEPGRGYWVRVSRDCSIQLSREGVHKTDLGRLISRVDPSWVKIEFGNVGDKKGAIYLADSLDSDRPYFLPPLPPDKGTDVRFAQNRYVEDARHSPVSMIVTGIEKTVELTVSNLGTKKLVIHRMIGDKRDIPILEGKRLSLEPRGYTLTARLTTLGKE